MESTSALPERSREAQRWRRAQESLAKSEALLAQAQQIAGVGSWSGTSRRTS